MADTHIGTTAVAPQLDSQMWLSHGSLPIESTGVPKMHGALVMARCMVIATRIANRTPEPMTGDRFDMRGARRYQLQWIREQAACEDSMTWMM